MLRGGGGERAGIRTFADLRRWERESLVARFGAGWETGTATVVMGLLLFAAIMFALGHDPRREIRDLLQTVRKQKEA